MDPAQIGDEEIERWIHPRPTFRSAESKPEEEIEGVEEEIQKQPPETGKIVVDPDGKAPRWRLGSPGYKLGRLNPTGDLMGDYYEYRDPKTGKIVVDPRGKPSTTPDVWKPGMSLEELSQARWDQIDAERNQKRIMEGEPPPINMNQFIKPDGTYDKELIRQLVK